VRGEESFKAAVSKFEGKSGWFGFEITPWNLEALKP
jgi:hypothetical protein